MKGLDLLTGRRSVRKFTDAPVTKELIEEIIDDYEIGRASCRERV